MRKYKEIKVNSIEEFMNELSNFNDRIGDFLTINWQIDNSKDFIIEIPNKNIIIRLINKPVEINNQPKIEKLDLVLYNNLKYIVGDIIRNENIFSLININTGASVAWVKRKDLTLIKKLVCHKKAIKYLKLNLKFYKYVSK